MGFRANDKMKMLPNSDSIFFIFVAITFLLVQLLLQFNIQLP